VQSSAPASNVTRPDHASLPAEELEEGGLGHRLAQRRQPAGRSPEATTAEMGMQILLGPCRQGLETGRGDGFLVQEAPDGYFCLDGKGHVRPRAPRNRVQVWTNAPLLIVDGV